MSGTYLTEEEQIEILKKFAKNYGPSILLGLFIAVAGLFGFRYYKERQLHIRTQAALAYSQLINSAVSNKPKQMKRQANYLIKEFANTPYASLAQLLLARNAVDNKDTKLALTQLQWVIEHSKQQPLVAIARVRTARIELANKQYKQALATLAKINAKSFSAVKAQVQGDVYTAQGKTVKAKAAYALALKDIDERATIKPVLEMKFDNSAA